MRYMSDDTFLGQRCPGTEHHGVPLYAPSHTSHERQVIAPRALFLDIDGVLHPSKAIEDVDLANPAMHAAEKLVAAGLFRHAQALRVALAGADDVMIIVHSSWRGTDWAAAVLREVLGPAFEGFTTAGLVREESIADVCSRIGIDDFLIVDDAHHEFKREHLRRRLLITNPLTGLDDATLAVVRDWALSTAAGIGN